MRHEPGVAPGHPPAAPSEDEALEGTDIHAGRLDVSAEDYPGVRVRSPSDVLAQQGTGGGVVHVPLMVPHGPDGQPRAPDMAQIASRTTKYSARWRPTSRT